MRLGIVIGTFERPAELEKTLVGCNNSSLSPEVIVVVDSSLAQSANVNQALCENFSNKKIEVVYLHTTVQSVTIQRNMGLDYLTDRKLDFIQILDDDTTPSVEHFSILAGFLAENQDVVGVSGIAPNDEAPTSSKVKRLPFVLAGLDSFRNGVVSRAGVGIPVSFADSNPQESEWLIGCAMWRKELIGDLRFDSTLRGSCLFDDVDFSLRARKHGRLFVITGALLCHSMSKLNRPDLELFHYRFSRNRWVVLRSMRAGPDRFFLFLISVALTALILGLLSLTDLHNRRTFLSAAVSSLRGYLDGLRNLPPK